MIKVQIKHQFPNFNLNLELEFPRGITALFGPSGAGKSLTLKSLSGIWTPQEGKVQLDETWLLDTQNKINISPQMRQCGFLFQNHNLFPHFTLLNNLLYGCPKASLEERNTKAQSLIEKFNLTGLQNNLPHQLSGGQIQRAALARALMRNPQYLLLDEPFSSLDSATKDKLAHCLEQVLQELNIPVILVTHDSAVAQKMASKTIFIDQGQLAQNNLNT